jgi:cytochrome P450
MSDRTCPSFDITADELAACPWSEFARLRESSPVLRSDRHGGYWAVTRWADVRTIARDPGGFCSGQGATIPRIGLPVPGIPVESDPPRHYGYRMLLLPLFRPDKVESYRPYVEDLTHRLIDSFAMDGTADLVEQFARLLPPRVITHLMGLPEDDADLVVAWHDLMRDSADTGDTRVNSGASQELTSYLLSRLDEKRASPRGDILSLIANGSIGDQPIDDTEALGIMLTLATAGFATTAHGISSALYLLGVHPAARQALLAQPSLIPAAIEEVLRIEPPVLMMGRTATADTQIEGVQVKSGDKVGLLFGSANHDPAKFDAPEDFQIERSPNHHLSFGFGIHRCLGEHLARLEMNVAVEAVLKRLPDYQIADPAALRWTNTMIRGLRALPVTFTPGDRAQLVSRAPQKS